MNIMAICIMLSVLLCTAILCIVMLSGVVTKEANGRDKDREQYEKDLQKARQSVTVTHMVEFDRAPRHFYNQAKESAAGAANTDDAQ